MSTQKRAQFFFYEDGRPKKKKVGKKWAMKFTKIRFLLKVKSMCSRLWRLRCGYTLARNHHIPTPRDTKIAHYK